ncbi:MAG: hypothetical protein ACI8ZB_003249 [Desulforhopalus sp.]|jgi:hypothetical protein
MHSKKLISIKLQIKIESICLSLGNTNFLKEDYMKNAWAYKNHEIEEGLKPGSKTFRFF